jgi:hypothetical protein
MSAPNEVSLGIGTSQPHWLDEDEARALAAELIAVIERFEKESNCWTKRE